MIDLHLLEIRERKKYKNRMEGKRTFTVHMEAYLFEELKVLMQGRGLTNSTLLLYCLQSLRKAK